MLTKMSPVCFKDKTGFTLIELMMVIAIIAILATIALFQFSTYHERAARAAMVSDAKHTATNLEAAFSDCQVYPALVVPAGSSLPIPENTLGPSCASLPATSIIIFTASKRNTITVTTPAANIFNIVVSNPNGAGIGYDPLTMIGGAGAAPSCAFANNLPC